jgi:hypothetical protein
MYVVVTSRYLQCRYLISISAGYMPAYLRIFVVLLSVSSVYRSNILKYRTQNYHLAKYPYLLTIQDHLHSLSLRLKQYR